MSSSAKKLVIKLTFLHNHTKATFLLKKVECVIFNRSADNKRRVAPKRSGNM